MLDIQLLRNDLAGVAARLRSAASCSTGTHSSRSRPSARRSRRAPRSCRRSATRSRKQIGAAKGKGEDAAAAMARGAQDRRRADRAGARARRHPGRIARLDARHAQSAARERAGRALGGGQRRSAALGHAARVRLPAARPRRRRRSGRRARVRNRGQALRRALLYPARRGRAPAPCAGPVHARPAYHRTRLHRVLCALHRQCRDAWPAPGSCPSSKTTCSA